MSAAAPLARLLFVATLALVAALTPAAWAQAFEVSALVDAAEVELGDTVTYTLKATSTGADAPSDPRLPASAGFTVVSQSAGPTHMISIVNGQRTDKRGLTASWTLRADRLGTFTIGPGTVALGGARRAGSTERVTVVAPGAGRPKARRPARSPFDPFGASPFDPFRGVFPGLLDDDAPPVDPFAGIPTDPSFALDEARAPGAFLHATVDKMRAVIGEQVTLNVYLYEDLRARQSRLYDVHEATATDFVKRSLLTDETRAIQVGHALVGGQTWSVKLVRKNALFPIKAGRLSISPMSLKLQQMRPSLRESEALFVDVAEPPVAGRPAGYQIGDVGDFSLSATVTPREVEQRGAIGVTVELRGTGNVPGALATPEVAGVEWLEPQTVDELGPAAGDAYGGTRTFSYVVRLQRAGEVDLGEIRLPYFDPRTRSYAVARTELGIVRVAPSSTPTDALDVDDRVLADLPRARTELEGSRPETYLTDRPLFWGALFGAPLLCVSALAFAEGARRVRERRASAAPSPTRLARGARAEADAALKGDDGKAACAAVARALEAEVLAASGVNLRGTSGDAARRELTDAGVPEAAAAIVLEVLSACDGARFSPEGVPIDQARALHRRAREAAAAVADSRSLGPDSERGAR